jgi:hypothetical protein
LLKTISSSPPPIPDFPVTPCEDKVEQFESAGIIAPLGKHTEKYGRKVSGLKVTMVAGPRQRTSSLCLPASLPLSILPLKT